MRATVTGLPRGTLAGELASAREALHAAGIDAGPAVRVERGARRSTARLFGWALREAVTNVRAAQRRDALPRRRARDTLEVVDDGSGPAAPARAHGLVRAGRRAGTGRAGLRDRAGAGRRFRLRTASPVERRLPACGADAAQRAQPAEPRRA